MSSRLHPEEEFIGKLLPLVISYLKSRYNSSLTEELSQLEDISEKIQRQFQRALDMRVVLDEMADTSSSETDDEENENDEGNRAYQISFSDLSPEFQDFVAMDLGYSGVPALRESLGNKVKEVAVTHLPVSPEWGSDKEF